ncbi:VOC family protein [Paenibacillus silvisoli]|uniref:VOC family protein n=1 Tax=Paenibacillus silvisoli TaxID=3110539 RepID=UPI0028040336|nr:VOC family protein [Paenibacillus silvisoli]
MFMRMELFVESLSESANFYTEVLGFAVEKESEKYTSVRNGHAIIGLGAMTQLVDNHYLKPKTEMERKGACVEIVLEVDEIEEYYNKIVKSNYPIHSELTNRPWGATDFRIVDPDGYYIRITSKS